MMKSRFLVALALAFTAALGQANAQSNPPLTKVRFGILTTASQAAFTVGVQAGIFRKHGFEVEVTPLATGAQANQALAADQVDWSGGGIESTVVAWATELPFTAYAMYAKGGDSYGILVRKESNINSAGGPARQDRRRAARHRTGAGVEPGRAQGRLAGRCRQARQRVLRRHGPDAGAGIGRCDGRTRAVSHPHRRRDAGQSHRC